MRKSQFNFLRDTFGDTSVAESERWKCVKYISHDKFILDVERLINNDTIIYIDNDDVGAGFYILGLPNSDMGIEDKNMKVITFFPLEAIISIGVTSKYITESLSEQVSGGLENLNNTQVIID